MKATQLLSCKGTTAQGSMPPSALSLYPSPCLGVFSNQIGPRSLMRTVRGRNTPPPGSLGGGTSSRLTRLCVRAEPASVWRGANAVLLKISSSSVDVNILCWGFLPEFWWLNPVAISSYIRLPDTPLVSAEVADSVLDILITIHLIPKKQTVFYFSQRDLLVVTGGSRWEKQSFKFFIIRNSHSMIIDRFSRN